MKDFFFLNSDTPENEIPYVNLKFLEHCHNRLNQVMIGLVMAHGNFYFIRMLAY